MPITEAQKAEALELLCDPATPEETLRTTMTSLLAPIEADHEAGSFPYVAVEEWSAEAEVLRAFAAIPHAPAWALRKLVGYFPYEVATNQSFSPRVHELEDWQCEALNSVPGSAYDAAFATHPDTNVRSMAASNEHIAPELLAGLLADSDLLVRRDAMTSVEYRMTHNPGDLTVTALLAARRQLDERSPDEQRSLISLAYEIDEALTRSAADPETPAAELALLAARASDEIRERVARNPSTPTEGLDALALHADENVRERVAEHPTTSGPSLSRLARDENKRIRELVAEHPNTLPGDPARLALDPEEYVRESAAWHLAMPAVDLTRLAADPSAREREAVAHNPNAPAEAIGLLVKDLDPHVADAAFHHEANPKD